MRRKYKPEIQAKLAQCSDITMEDEINVMLSALSGSDFSNLPFNGDGQYINVVLESEPIAEIRGESQQREKYIYENNVGSVLKADAIEF